MCLCNIILNTSYYLSQVGGGYQGKRIGTANINMSLPSLHPFKIHQTRRRGYFFWRDEEKMSYMVRIFHPITLMMFGHFYLRQVIRKENLISISDKSYQKREFNFYLKQRNWQKVQWFLEIENQFVGNLFLPNNESLQF